MALTKTDIVTFLKSTFIFLIGNVVSKAAMIILLPLYTYLLPAADLGYYDVSTTCITLVATAVYFEAWTAVMRFMYSKADKSNKLASMRAGLIVFCVSTGIYTLLYFAVAQLGLFSSIELIFTYGFSLSLVNYCTFASRGMGCNVEFAASGVINTFSMIGLNIVLIWFCGMGYEALYFAAVVGNILQVLFLLWRAKLIKIGKFQRSDLQLAKEIAIFAFPMSANAIVYWFQASFGKVAINILCGSALNGIFSVGSKFSVTLSLVTMCFTYAWQESAFKRADDSGKNKYFSDATSAYLLFIFFGISLLLPLIKMIFPILVGPEYSSAEETIPLFVLVAGFSAFSAFMGNTIIAENKPFYNFLTALPSAILNVALSFPLIYFYGINGANLACILAFSFTIITRCILLHQLFGLRLEKKVLIPIALSLVAMLVFINGSLIVNVLFFVSELVSLAILVQYSRLKKRRGEK